MPKTFVAILDQTQHDFQNLEQKYWKYLLHNRANYVNIDYFLKLPSV
jgi:hypothetical protein